MSSRQAIRAKFNEYRAQNSWSRDILDIRGAHPEDMIINADLYSRAQCFDRFMVLTREWRAQHPKAFEYAVNHLVSGVFIEDFYEDEPDVVNDTLRSYDMFLFIIDKLDGLWALNKVELLLTRNEMITKIIKDADLRNELQGKVPTMGDSAKILELFHEFKDGKISLTTFCAQTSWSPVEMFTYAPLETVIADRVTLGLTTEDFFDKITRIESSMIAFNEKNPGHPFMDEIYDHFVKNSVPLMRELSRTKTGAHLFGRFLRTDSPAAVNLLVNHNLNISHYGMSAANFVTALPIDILVNDKALVTHLMNTQPAHCRMIAKVILKRITADDNLVPPRDDITDMQTLLQGTLSDSTVADNLHVYVKRISKNAQPSKWPRTINTLKQHVPVTTKQKTAAMAFALGLMLSTVHGFTNIVSCVMHIGLGISYFPSLNETAQNIFLTVF